MKQSIYLIFCTLFFVACSKKNATGTPGEVQKGVVSGTITDPSGKPIEGVSVYAGHDTHYNTNVIGVTDSKGNYSLDLKGQPNGTWSIHAELVKTYNDRTYTFWLQPENTTPVTTTEGGQRNLKWQLKGVIPGSTDDSRIGGYVTFIQSGFEYVPVEEIEFVLEPVGALVDGSQGQTITRMAELFPYNLTGLYNTEGLRDIPVGRYNVSAKHKPANGAAKQLKVSRKGAEQYGQTIVADFKQDAAYTFQEMELNIMVE